MSKIFRNIYVIKAKVRKLKLVKRYILQQTILSPVSGTHHLQFLPRQKMFFHRSIGVWTKSAWPNDNLSFPGGGRGSGIWLLWLNYSLGIFWLFSCAAIKQPPANNQPVTRLKATNENKNKFLTLIPDNTLKQKKYTNTIQYQTNARIQNTFLPYMNIKQHTLLYREPHVWNSLPSNIKSPKTIKTFKNKLRDYILFFLALNDNIPFSSTCFYIFNDGFRSGCRNVSQHQQQSFSGLHYKPGRSLKPQHWLIWVQTFHCYNFIYIHNVFSLSFSLFFFSVYFCANPFSDQRQSLPLIIKTTCN